MNLVLITCLILLSPVLMAEEKHPRVESYKTQLQTVEKKLEGMVGKIEAYKQSVERAASCPFPHNRKINTDDIELVDELTRLQDRQNYFSDEQLAALDEKEGLKAKKDLITVYLRRIREAEEGIQTVCSQATQSAGTLGAKTNPAPLAPRMLSRDPEAQ